MKLKPLAIAKNANRVKMIITTEQFRTLAQNVISEQKQGNIKSTYLIKQNSNVKKK